MMKDFSLLAYEQYLTSIRKQFKQILTFEDYFRFRPDNGFCLIRHDVDRKPKNALKMAELEADMGVQSTYYFRDKASSWNSSVVHQIRALGHEVGYHYECLSDANGDPVKALEIFKNTLGRLRSEVPIRTISMHGRPLSPFDSRDIFRDEDERKLLFASLDVLGEVYLDIDYSNIAYINDTGRNWSADASNLRDHVESNLSSSFDSGQDLREVIASGELPSMVFQVHPERWTDDWFEWYAQASKDRLFNLIKWMIGAFR